MSKLVVIGSSNTDMIVQVPRIPQPGETILGARFQTAPGGKGANQAVAAARAGGDVTLLACIGDDMFGREALAGFATDGIDCEHVVIDPTAPSGVAQIFVAADGENSIGVASGANACLTPRHIAQAASAIEAANTILLQLEIPLETVMRAAEIGSAADCRVILNPAPAHELPRELYPLLSIISPNETEAELLTGIAVKDESSAAGAAASLRHRGVDTVLITLGAAGVYLSTEAFNKIVPGYVVDVVDTTAAGDVFNGNLAAALCRDLQLEDALVYAQAAAALSVQRLGAQPSAPMRSAIDTFLSA
ncbi:MAG: ribokinase [Gammaproteobacteria bacterium]|nr:ribokinase [Gammaproteobacteria bacterium]